MKQEVHAAESCYKRWRRTAGDGMLAQRHLPLRPAGDLQQGVGAQVADTLVTIRALKCNDDILNCLRSFTRD